MQKLIRQNYCLFSYDTSQDKDIYFDKKAVLTACANECATNLKQKPFSNSLIIAQVPYDKRNKLFFTIAGYKHYIFYGLFDGNTEHISFADNDSKIVTLDDTYIMSLRDRFINELNNPSNIKAKSIEVAWQKCIPLLDKIIEYEDNLNSLEETKHNIIKHSMIYDEQIDNFINAYEEGTLDDINLINFQPFL